MTASTTTGRTPVTLHDPAELLASLPYLLGVRPRDSVVLLGHRAPARNRLGLVLRADLPDPEDSTRQATALAARYATGEYAGVTVAVIGGRRRPGAPPHAEFVADLAGALGDSGLPVLHAMWAEEIRADAPWGCYADDKCGGRLPDPRTTVAAAVMTERGCVVFDSRAEMAEFLAGRDPAAIDRRAAKLAALPELPWPPQSESSDAAAEITAALRHQRSGEPFSDDQLVRLACALSITSVRDACLGMAVPPGTPTARAAEQLWLTLVRELPAPERAEAGALLAYSFFLRGEGSLAGMALDNALRAKPDHELSKLLKSVLHHGIEPERLYGLATGCAL